MVHLFFFFGVLVLHGVAAMKVIGLSLVHSFCSSVELSSVEYFVEKERLELAVVFVVLIIYSMSAEILVKVFG